MKPVRSHRSPALRTRPARGCPGTVDSNTCSGITQNTWDFSHILKPFTG